MTDQLFNLASIWAQRSDRSLSRLATRVQNDGRFFDRLQQSGNCTTDTFEKFLTFFRDGVNWPDSVIPMVAVELLANFENMASAAHADGGPCAGGDAVASVGDAEHVPTNSVDAATPSTGLSDELSRQSEQEIAA